jgi:hypothetical protein
MPPRIPKGLSKEAAPQPESLFGRKFSLGHVALGLLEQRQTFVDLIRRSGLEVGDVEGGWRQLSFVDAVLLRITVRRARYMSTKDAAAVANALRRFVAELVVSVAPTSADAKLDAFVKLGVDRPMAVLVRDETAPVPRWKASAYSSRAALAAALDAGDKELRKAAALPDEDPGSWLHDSLTGEIVLVNMAHEILATVTALTRVGVEQ